MACGSCCVARDLRLLPLKQAHKVAVASLEVGCWLTTAAGAGKDERFSIFVVLLATFLVATKFSPIKRTFPSTARSSTTWPFRVSNWM